MKADRERTPPRYLEKWKLKYVGNIPNITNKISIFISYLLSCDCLCGLAVRAPGINYLKRFLGFHRLKSMPSQKESRRQ
jgi:hypothetical protein